MFKRPLPRPTPCVYTPAPAPFLNGSRAGAIIENMRSAPACQRPSSEWVPSIDYEFIAAQMDPVSAKAYRERSEAWFQLHKAPEIPPTDSTPQIDYAPILAVLEKYKGHRPPLDDYLEALEQAGHSETVRESCRRLYKMLEETSDERQRKLDAIFAKWPAANKATPKPKKVIKVVKKKMAS